MKEIMKNIVPIGDRVLVDRDKAQAKTPGGIIIPEQAKQTPTRGKVVAIGTGRTSNDDGLDVGSRFQVGDRVIFNNYAGMEIEFNGEKLLILNESDIVAKEEN